MLHPDALASFAQSQKALVVATYNQAWHRGVASYPPPDRPHDAEAESARQHDEELLTGAALLAARRRRQYVAPAHPDQYRRAIAVAPALSGVNSMVVELSTLSPTPEQIAGAADAQGALAEAMAQWAETNSWRLNGGESAAWAGEQAGYGEAADAAGDLLDWQTEGDDHVCDSCDALGSMGPMPLGEWPTTPGAGDTDCAVGCRCSLESVSAFLAGDTYQPQSLTDDQQAAVNQILDTRSSALDGLMPDMAMLG